jgi:hypothetical protein
MKVGRVRTTIMLGEPVLRAVRAKAARTGRTENQVIENALRRDLGLELLKNSAGSSDLDADEALRIAVEEQHEARRSR